jgi:hypothetical protein
MAKNHVGAMVKRVIERFANTFPNFNPFSAKNSDPNTWSKRNNIVSAIEKWIWFEYSIYFVVERAKNINFTKSTFEEDSVFVQTYFLFTTGNAKARRDPTVMRRSCVMKYCGPAIIYFTRQKE